MQPKVTESDQKRPKATRSNRKQLKTTENDQKRPKANKSAHLGVPRKWSLKCLGANIDIIFIDNLVLIHFIYPRYQGLGEQLDESCHFFSKTRKSFCQARHSAAPNQRIQWQLLKGFTSLVSCSKFQNRLHDFVSELKIRVAKRAWERAKKSFGISLVFFGLLNLHQCIEKSRAFASPLYWYLKNLHPSSSRGRFFSKYWTVADTVTAHKDEVSDEAAKTPKLFSLVSCTSCTVDGNHKLSHTSLNILNLLLGAIGCYQMSPDALGATRRYQALSGTSRHYQALLGAIRRY